MWSVSLYLSKMPFSELSLHITDQHQDLGASWPETPGREREGENAVGNLATDAHEGAKGSNPIGALLFLTLPNEPWPRTLSSSNWEGSAFSQPSFTWWVIGISLYVPSSCTQTVGVKIQDRTHQTQCVPRPSLLTQSENGSPSSIGSSMISCPLTCSQTHNINQGTWTRWAPSQDLSGLVFKRSWTVTASAHANARAYEGAPWPKNERVTCVALPPLVLRGSCICCQTVWTPYSKPVQLSSLHPAPIEPLRYYHSSLIPPGWAKATCLPGLGDPDVPSGSSHLLAPRGTNWASKPLPESLIWKNNNVIITPNALA